MDVQGTLVLALVIVGIVSVALFGRLTFLSIENPAIRWVFVCTVLSVVAVGALVAALVLVP